jgi:hypothetical protein
MWPEARCGGQVLALVALLAFAGCAGRPGQHAAALSGADVAYGMMLYGHDVIEGAAVVQDGRILVSFSNDTEERARLLHLLVAADRSDGPVAPITTPVADACWGMGVDSQSESGLKVYVGAIRCIDGGDLKLMALKAPSVPVVGNGTLGCRDIFTFIVGGTPDMLRDWARATRNGDARTCNDQPGTMT